MEATGAVSGGLAALWARYREFRELEDREQLILAYQHLVALARPRTTSATGWFDDNDFLQAGVIGLCEAIDRYDPAQGVPFEAYAARRIKGAMTDSLRSEVDVVSRRTRTTMRKVEQAREQFLAQHHREPSVDELATSVGLSVTVVKEILTVAAAAADTPPLTHDAYQVPCNDSAEVDTWWRQAVRDLPERERTVVALHYLESLTLEDIGIALGISKPTVLKIKTRAVTRLQDAAKAAA